MEFHAAGNLGVDENKGSTFGEKSQEPSEETSGNMDGIGVTNSKPTLLGESEGVLDGASSVIPETADLEALNPDSPFIVRRLNECTDIVQGAELVDFLSASDAVSTEEEDENPRGAEAVVKSSEFENVDCEGLEMASKSHDGLPSHEDVGSCDYAYHSEVSTSKDQNVHPEKDIVDVQLSAKNFKVTNITHASTKLENVSIPDLEVDNASSDSRFVEVVAEDQVNVMESLHAKAVASEDQAIDEESKIQCRIDGKSKMGSVLTSPVDDLLPLNVESMSTCIEEGSPSGFGHSERKVSATLESGFDGFTNPHEKAGPDRKLTNERKPSHECPLQSRDTDTCGTEDWDEFDQNEMQSADPVVETDLRTSALWISDDEGKEAFSLQFRRAVDVADSQKPRDTSDGTRSMNSPDVNDPPHPKQSLSYVSFSDLTLSFADAVKTPFSLI